MKEMVKPKVKSFCVYHFFQYWCTRAEVRGNDVIIIPSEDFEHPAMLLLLYSGCGKNCELGAVTRVITSIISYTYIYIYMYIQGFLQPERTGAELRYLFLW
jgi:hypothetical protein